MTRAKSSSWFSDWRASVDAAGPISEREVLADELRAVCTRRERLGLQRQSSDDSWQAALFGLCLSGGGIRSATFNLGVLQALAKYRLLRSVDYLSTVSGGGYVGGWLTALIRRRCIAERAAAGNEHGNGVLDFDDFEQALAWSGGDGGNADAEAQELAAIRKLRAHSNYLTPKLGVLSGDFWALIAIYVRNALLNQLVLVFALACLLLIPRFFSDLLRQLDELSIAALGYGGELLAAAGTLGLVVLGVSTLGKQLAGVVLEQASESRSGATAAQRGKKWAPKDTAGIIVHLVLPRLAIGLLGAVWLPPVANWAGNRPGTWLSAAVIGGLVNLAVWWLAAMVAGGRRHSLESARSFWQAMTGASAFFAGAFVLGPLAFAASLALADVGYMGYRVIVAPPIVIGVLLASSIVHIGLAGNGVPSLHREWLSRLAGINGIIALAWIAVTALVFLSPLLVDLLPAYLDIPLVAAWITSTLGGVYLGRTSVQASLPRRVFTGLAPWVFILGLMILASAGLQGLLHSAASGAPDSAVEGSYADYAAGIEAFEESLTPAEQDEAAAPAPVPLPWGRYAAWLAATESLLLIAVAFVIAAALAWLFARRVNINSFSLHNLYANRIVRAFLGASVEERRSNPFTDFSSSDDLTLSAAPVNGCFVQADPHESQAGATRKADDRAPLTSREERAERWRDVAYPGPYHIINTAINLVSSRNLAWQERKAGSFILSPLFCGFSESGTNPDSGAYRLTTEFSSRPKPLTLGEAVAVSGAAASPNMGYHTTPALAFLLGVFNIRLGRWVGNPNVVEKSAKNRLVQIYNEAFALHEEKWRNAGPKFALMHLLREVFGMTDERRSFVYLSDGGHFENLGLYEMIRRRCRYVIVCDSGADPSYAFEDLGNAIRKCRIDFGVEIELDPHEIARIDDGACNAAPCAVGKIRYSPKRVGTLLYIKASRRRGMPPDVMQYALEHRAFPHESTGDQFFSESQFESYRRLGYFIACQVLDGAIEELDGSVENGKELPLARLFDRLEQNWYPASETVSTHFGRLAAQADVLFERLRESDELEFLNEQFYPEWQTLLNDTDTEAPAVQDPRMWTLPSDPRRLKHGFYFCNSLIRLMENVYIDLNLESEWHIPDNSGWMNVFRHWAWSSMFQVTWAISAATYGRRFRAFCRQRLDLEVGTIVATPVFEGPRVDPELDERLLAAGLNAVEQGQIARLLRLDHARREIDAQTGRVTVYRLDLQVDVRSGLGPLRTFGFGYALLSGSMLLMFRVQDHLRNMELGQRGLRSLVAAQARRGGIEMPEDTAEIAAFLSAVGEDPERAYIDEFRAKLASLQ